MSPMYRDMNLFGLIPQESYCFKFKFHLQLAALL